MAFSGPEDRRPHVQLGGLFFRVDQNAPDEIQRPAYRRFSRNLFTGRTDITGRPGAQNLNPDVIRWFITNFDGEGQKVLDNDNPLSARRFWQSEGLDFRTAGQASLNRSTILQVPVDSTGGATTTKQGSADFSDVTGTSTGSLGDGTDRRLNATGDVVGSSNHAPGAGAVTVDFYLYKEAPQSTTIEGSSFVQRTGDGKVSGSDYLLKDGKAWSSKVSTGATNLTADVPAKVTFTTEAMSSLSSPTFAVEDVTDTDNPKAVVAGRYSSLTPGQTITLTFTPQSGKDYRFSVRRPGDGSRATFFTIDNVTYGASEQATSVTLTVRNATAGSNVISKTVTVSSTEAGVKVSTLSFLAAAATNYTYRVTYNSGPQRPLVDKAVGTVQTTTATGFKLDALELGQGGQIWLFGSRSGGDIQPWTYDFTNEDWDAGPALNASSTSGENVVSLAHTDSYEYALTTGGKIFRLDTSADAAFVTGLTDAVAITVAQGRMFVLTEDDNTTPSASTGVRILLYDLDGATGTQLQDVQVASLVGPLDNTLRQRMVATPSGARFFVNYSDVDAVIYEADASGTTVVTREIARLDPGVRATAIAYSAGITFIAGQFLAETGETPVSGLWVIDQNGALRRIGLFRRVGGTSAIVSDLQPYQNDLWALQGKYVWRYSLVTGGLFLEYELGPASETAAKAIGVVQGHQFAVFNTEDSTQGAVWVTGSVSSYRQSSVADGNTHTSSVYDMGLPGIAKTLTAIRVLADDLPSNTAIRVEIQVDQDGTWTDIGTMTSGTKQAFLPSNEVDAVVYENLQVRTTLVSTTGAATPTWKGTIVESLPTEEEQFFDLILLTEDEDSTFHIPGQQVTGGQAASRIWQLKESGVPTTFVDGFHDSAPGTTQDYLVRVEDVDLSNDEAGEGRMSVRLRILG